MSTPSESVLLFAAFVTVFFFLIAITTRRLSFFSLHT